MNVTPLNFKLIRFQRVLSHVCDKYMEEWRIKKTKELLKTEQINIFLLANMSDTNISALPEKNFIVLLTLAIP